MQLDAQQSPRKNLVDCYVASSKERIQDRISKLRLLPYGMTSEDSPPVPRAVDDPEDVAKQEYALHTLPE